jgi:hypothetical protein
VHIVDVIGVCVAAGVLVLLALVLARQRFMLRAAGAVPVAVRGRGGRWQYGVARYAGSELRWYRSLGLGTRPSRVLHRDRLRIVAHRTPLDAELAALPATAVVVHCLDGPDETVIALGVGAFTGLRSWLEASAPHS